MFVPSDYIELRLIGSLLLLGNMYVFYLRGFNCDAVLCMVQSMAKEKSVKQQLFHTDILNCPIINWAEVLRIKVL